MELKKVKTKKQTKELDLIDNQRYKMCNTFRKGSHLRNIFTEQL